MIGLILLKNGKAFDISNLVETVTWSGRKGAAGRSISVSLLDSEDYGYKRSGIDVEDGDHCLFTWKNEELFQGLIVNQGQNKSKKLTFKARDNLIYFANNSDTFNYKDKKASEIFIDCCQRFKISYGEVADTGHRIPTLPKPDATIFDVICDALSITYKATGVRYYPESKKGKAQLIRRRDNVKQWVIETGQNLIDYDFSKSIEEIATRIKLISDRGTVIAESVNSALEKKIGIFQKTEKPDDKMNSAQLQQMVDSMLKEKGTVKSGLSISGLGIPDVTSGIGVYVIIKELGIKRSFYVDEDSHTFKGNYHSMKLSLNMTNEF